MPEKFIQFQVVSVNGTNHVWALGDDGVIYFSNPLIAQGAWQEFKGSR